MGSSAGFLGRERRGEREYSLAGRPRGLRRSAKSCHPAFSTAPPAHQGEDRLAAAWLAGLRSPPPEEAGGEARGVGGGEEAGSGEKPRPARARARACFGLPSALRPYPARPKRSINQQTFASTGLRPRDRIPAHFHSRLLISLQLQFSASSFLLSPEYIWRFPASRVFACSLPYPSMHVPTAHWFPNTTPVPSP